MSRIPKMIKVLPVGKSGSVEIKHRVVTEEEAKFSNFRAAFGHPLEVVEIGAYAMLVIDNEIVMSDTRMERDSNQEFIFRASGKVLIAGLGIGMIVKAIINEGKVTEVIVIEKSPDVIKLVAPYLQHPKLTIIEADIFEAKPLLKDRKPFDTIYFDIWPTICTDHLEEIAKLHHMYKNFLNRLNPHCWMGSWMQSYLRTMKREGEY